jgi:hypothetical protein
MMILAAVLSLAGVTAALAKEAEPTLRRTLVAQQMEEGSTSQGPLPSSEGSFIKRQSEQYNQGNGQ